MEFFCLSSVIVLDSFFLMNSNFFMILVVLTLSFIFLYLHVLELQSIFTRLMWVIQGYILTSEIDGTIQMKSYLTGNPEIRLALNDDLSIGSGGRSIYGIAQHNRDLFKYSLAFVHVILSDYSSDLWIICWIYMIVLSCKRCTSI